MTQTPAQRIANQKYAKREERKKGKPESAYKKKKTNEKPPVSWGWIYVFGFLIAGGIVLELINLFFGSK
ncbi:uncharacterized protein V2V93DRAFT_89546 [Kockiozyma suomiensis]|uniref:uncharacterized protein n=1 Tax=Kockiozyma suomiensis TaxID=1337062 RepID=UPI00334351D2